MHGTERPSLPLAEFFHHGYGVGAQQDKSRIGERHRVSAHSPLAMVRIVKSFFHFMCLYAKTSIYIYIYVFINKYIISEMQRRMRSLGERSQQEHTQRAANRFRTVSVTARKKTAQHKCRTCMFEMK